MPAQTLPKGAPGPLLGTLWWTLTVGVAAYIAAGVDATAYHLLLGYRSLMALAGYLVMQVGLWAAENRWDEMGSKAYLDEAKKTMGKVSGGQDIINMKHTCSLDIKIMQPNSEAAMRTTMQRT